MSELDGSGLTVEVWVVFLGVAWTRLSRPDPAARTEPALGQPAGSLPPRTWRKPDPVDDAVVDALAGPLKLVPVIIALFFSLNTLQAGAAENSLFIGDGENIIRTLITIAIFWALHNAVDPVMHLFKGLQNTLTPLMLDWLDKALKIIFIIVGVAAILELWGISVGPIIAGLGLFGVAVGLGAQDLFKNLIAGLLILTEKRFLPGDWIKVDGVVEGTVEEVNFRSTLVRRSSRARSMCPMPSWPIMPSSTFPA